MAHHHADGSGKRTAIARAVRQSSTASPALDGASQDCTPATPSLSSCAARTISENRTPHSIRAEIAARSLRPIAKARLARSGLSAELDGAMARLGLTNQAVAARLGVTEKTVREWRGRGLLAGEEPKAIPGFQLARLPEELFYEMLVALRVVRREELAVVGGERR